MNETEMSTKIAELAQMRALRDAERAARDELYLCFIQSEEYIARTMQIDNTKIVIEQLEAEVRQAVVDHYVATGEKKLHAAVGVRMTKCLAYEEGLARQYCLEHLPTLMALDKKRFEQVALELFLEFVTIIEEPQATIAQDLSAYLQTEGAHA